MTRGWRAGLPPGLTRGLERIGTLTIVAAIGLCLAVTLVSAWLGARLGRMVGYR